MSGSVMWLVLLMRISGVMKLFYVVRNVNSLIVMSFGFMVGSSICYSVF